MRLVQPWSYADEFTINNRRTDSNGWMDVRAKCWSARRSSDDGNSRRAALAPARLRTHGRRRTQGLDPGWPAQLATMAAGP